MITGRKILVFIQWLIQLDNFGYRIDCTFVSVLITIKNIWENVCSLILRLYFMMYYLCRPRSDNKLFQRNVNAKYPPIPLPWPMKNENIIYYLSPTVQEERWYISILLKYSSLKNKEVFVIISLLRRDMLLVLFGRWCHFW